MKTKRARFGRLLLGLAMIAALVGSFAMPALATEGFQVDINIDTVLHAPVGSITELATEAVPAQYHGQLCQVESAVADNQQSTHPGNNLIVGSGGGQVVLENVEDQPDGHTVAEGVLTLGPTIVVSLEMGEDHTFSAGMIVSIDCSPSGWACVDGEVVFIQDASNFEGTLYDTAEEAAADPGCSDVLASTTFTIGASCVIVDGAPGFSISGNVGEGVSLQVAGQTVNSVGAYSINVAGPGSYPYSVTLDEGFVLAEGSPPAEGAVQVVDCSTPPESGWACVDGSVVFIDDATNFEGTLYASAEEAADDAGCIEVAASIVVSVTGSCASSGENGVINVTVSVAGGAVVAISNSSGTTLANFDDDGTLAVNEDATYTWTATPTEGFEFPAGSATTGSIVIDTCVEELPFTGPDTGVLVPLGLLSIGAGVAILAAQRRREEV